MNSLSLPLALKTGREKLKVKGIESYSIDALVLLCYCMQMKKEQVLTHDEIIMSQKQQDEYENCLEKRLNNMPVPYITNRQEFMGIDFYVDQNVLIPRPDTEILIENIVEIAKGIKKPRILDLCTGSGCVAVSSACMIKDSEVIGTDISPKVIEIARHNAKSKGIDGRIEFLVSDIFENLNENIEKFDIIVSNPPYIRRGDIEKLMPSVKDFEPLIALDGGESGLNFYSEIAAEAHKYLKEGGRLLFEIGFDQLLEVEQILKDNNYENIEVYKDLGGRDRVLKGSLKGLVGKNV